jgi:hypothetical protein
MDLSSYPATRLGAWEMVAALAPDILNLWRDERQRYLTDDLIAVINARSNRIKVESRTAVYQQMKRRLPTLDLLEYVSKKPNASNGSICIWVVIGFQTGQLCCLPLTIAYS